MTKHARNNDFGFVEPTPDDISPLSLFSILLSTSALCNAHARWVLSNLDELRDVGGYEASRDMQLCADVLIAMVEDNLEEWQNYIVKMPPGFAHIPWSVRKVSDEEKGDLPF